MEPKIKKLCPSLFFSANQLEKCNQYSVPFAQIDLIHANYMISSKKKWISSSLVNAPYPGIVPKNHLTNHLRVHVNSRFNILQEVMDFWGFFFKDDGDLH